MKLSKQQISALANQIYNSIDFEKVTRKKQIDWFKSSESLEYRKTIRPLFLKAKELIEKYGFDEIKFKGDTIREHTTEEDFFTSMRYGYNNSTVSWRLKISNPTQSLIENEIVLASIDAKTVEELTSRIMKKYEY